ncbi:MAG: topoisomerase DNA-binding C4 zinc finger domain-containing protein [Bacillota bacterium]
MNVEKVDMTQASEEKCPNCGRPMVIKVGRFGKFLACSGGEGTTTFVAVTSGCYLLTRSPIVSLILGATATPTAAATVMMVLHQYTPRGKLTRLLRSTVALDDVVATAAGAIVIAIAGWFTLGSSAGGPLVDAIGVVSVLLAGLGGGALLVWGLPRLREYGHRSGLIIGILLAFLALVPISPVAPPVAGLIAGMVLVNSVRYSRAFWHQFEEFLDFIYMMFFVYLGAHLQPSLLLSAPLILAVYIVARSLGKGIGSTLGCTYCSLTPGTGFYLGTALMPQGTLSLILAAMAEKATPTSAGLILNVVLMSILFFEFVGPFGTSLAIHHYHEEHDININRGVSPAG